MKAVINEQMRQLDQRTIAAGTPGEVLMDRAGLAVARETFELLKPTGSRSVLLLAGKGNNGGDAIVAARHLAGAGCDVTLALLCRRGELQGDALIHFQKLTGNVRVEEIPAFPLTSILSPGEERRVTSAIPSPLGGSRVREAALSCAPEGQGEGGDVLSRLVEETQPSVIVDGLLGTGLTGEVREPYVSAIRFINSSGLPVVAIDVPSGLGTSTCVRADVTMTFGLPKIGLLEPSAVEFVGRLEVADIGLLADVESDVELIAQCDVVLPARRRAAHKGDFGHLLIIAGNEGYTGAPVLAAHGAARSGVGLVTLAVPRAVYPIVAANCPPEVMPRPMDEELPVGEFDAIAVGPGMGHSLRTRKILAELLASAKVPVVVDADGLNVLAEDLSVLKRAKVPVVLTPHPGEMGRLVGKTAAEVQAARWETARAFAKEHGVTLVLKGAGTVVTDQAGKLWVNLTGNPGMAKGGMGDVLTGIIGALLAQGMPAMEAAKAGVYVHGRAGDLAQGRWGERAMLAGDLVAELGEVWRNLSKGV